MPIIDWRASGNRGGGGGEYARDDWIRYGFVRRALVPWCYSQKQPGSCLGGLFLRLAEACWSCSRACSGAVLLLLSDSVPAGRARWKPGKLILGVRRPRRRPSNPGINFSTTSTASPDRSCWFIPSSQIVARCAAPLRWLWAVIHWWLVLKSRDYPNRITSSCSVASASATT